jgi:hypothetical protein
MDGREEPMAEKTPGTGETRSVEAKPSAAWPGFEARLAEVLIALEEDQFLVIAAKRGWVYVQFAGQGSYGIRAESVSNGFLPESEALNADQIAALEALGWSAPTGTPEETNPQRQPEGSPNFFRDFPAPPPVGEIARLAVRTLTEVLGIPHPGHLEYQAFSTDHQVLLLPTLGLKRRPPNPAPARVPAETREQVRELVLQGLRKAGGDPDLDFNDQGQICLRFGSALVIVEVHKDPLCVSVSSPVLANVEDNEALLHRLNELNARSWFARLFVVHGIVHATLDLMASPLVADQVVQACAVMGGLADSMDDRLQREFGGRTTFGEFSSKPTVH